MAGAYGAGHRREWINGWWGCGGGGGGGGGGEGGGSELLTAATGCASCNDLAGGVSSVQA